MGRSGDGKRSIKFGWPNKFQKDQLPFFSIFFKSVHLFLILASTTIIICAHSCSLLCYLKAHVHPRCIARPVLQKKPFCVVENRCLQCVESIFVNLPQFAKSGLKEGLNRFFWYFSLHLFGHFGLVSSLFVSVSACFTAVDRVDGGRRRTWSTFVSVNPFF